MLASNELTERHEIAKKCQQQQIGLCEQVRCAAKVSVLDFVQPG